MPTPASDGPLARLLPWDLMDMPHSSALSPVTSYPEGTLMSVKGLFVPVDTQPARVHAEICGFKKQDLPTKEGHLSCRLRSKRRPVSSGTSWLPWAADGQLELTVSLGPCTHAPYGRAPSWSRLQAYCYWVSRGRESAGLLQFPCRWQPSVLRGCTRFVLLLLINANNRPAVSKSISACEQETAFRMDVLVGEDFKNNFLKSPLHRSTYAQIIHKINYMHISQKFPF